MISNLYNIALFVVVKCERSFLNLRSSLQNSKIHLRLATFVSMAMIMAFMFTAVLTMIMAFMSTAAPMTFVPSVATSVSMTTTTTATTKQQ